MCAIAGTIDLAPGLGSGEYLVARMTDALLHRGPDDAGMLVDPPAVIGHRRLSILDLSSAGHGPMASPDGAQWITYNGEIYNYLELARDLRALGHRFDSSCDTEVLLHAYGEWGPEALPRLNGMFAFAIWDRVRQELFCARDRFGVKPFYYTVAGGRFRFASEIKALLLDPDVARAPNHERVLDFLAFGVGDHTPETMFDGIFQLPPGCFLAVSPATGLGTVRRWYEPAPADLGGEAVEDAIGDRLRDSVSLRLRSDVPVGTCLSGGLDSSSIVSIASSLRQSAGAPPPDSFTARCEDPSLDEMHYVRTLVAETGSRNHDVLPTGSDVTDGLDRVLWHMDEPFHAASVLAQSKVMQLARKAGVTVLLDGNGGDEVFAGYHYMYPGLFYSLVRGGRFFSAGRELLARRRLHRVSPARTLIDVLRLSLPRRLRGRTLPSWLNPELGTPRRPLPERTLHGQQLYGLKVWPLPFYLHHEDRNSMSFALEARVPFLDYRVVEAGLALRPDELVRRGMTKWALRKAMAGSLPKEIVERTAKQGFSTDEASWLRGGLGADVEEIFRSATTADRPYFRPEALLRALEAHRAGAGDPAELWRAFCVERWLRLFIDPPRLAAPPALPGMPTTAVSASDRIVRLGVAEAASA